MDVFTIVMVIIGLALFIGFNLFMGNISARVFIPPQECPDCHVKMDIIMSNIYIGRVLYKCPKCGKELSYYYEEDELVRESDGFRCPLNYKKSENDKEKEK